MFSKPPFDTVSSGSLPGAGFLVERARRLHTGGPAPGRTRTQNRRFLRMKNPYFYESPLEATPGIEPGYTALQAVASATRPRRQAVKSIGTSRFSVTAQQSCHRTIARAALGHHRSTPEESSRDLPAPVEGQTSEQFRAAQQEIE